MSTSLHKSFIAKSEKIAFDLEHRRKIKFNISKYNDAVSKGNSRYADKNNAREQAAIKKRLAIDNLAEHLTEFEKKFSKNGGFVLWAKDAHEANNQIKEILHSNNVKLVVKSKSMTTEELNLNEELEKVGITSVESDLGEYIVQLANEKPYHIVTPAMHKSKQDVAKLFHDLFGSSIDSTPEELTALARRNLRDFFLTAGAGITGGNFILPDIGGIAVTENEGNALMTTAFPKIHIAVVGIEKVIPSFKDLALFWPHLAQHGTGQAISVYNSIFTGPKKNNELTGPEKMYVILLDNNRTRLYNSTHKIALTCIRCGACLNACPIYKNVGGYTYDTTYQGPIGTVISPHLKDFKHFQHLSTACSLCGNCSEVCPVKIPLDELIHQNRTTAAKKKSAINIERISIRSFTFFMKYPIFMDISHHIKNAAFSRLFSKLWGNKRNMPVFKKTFRSSYKK